MPQVLPRSTLELKVRGIWWSRTFVIRVRRFLMVLGRRSAKVAPKRVLSAQDAFRDPKTIKKRRTRMEKCGLCHFGAKRAPTAPLERLGAFGPLRTPKNVGHVCKSAKVDFCNFISIFRKIKKLQKVAFALLHTCTTFFGVLRGPNAPSRSSGAVGALFAPK